MGEAKRREGAGRFSTPAEVAERFGVSRRTVYAWMSSGRLQGTKVGPKLWHISEVQIAAFLEASQPDRPVVAPLISVPKQQPAQPAAPAAPAPQPALPAPKKRRR